MICHANSIDLHYEKSGSGKPLLLLHGNGETHSIFDRAIPALASHFTVYAIDSRGHGKSSPVHQYHYADFAEDIFQFIQVLELDTPVLYGFSDGGIIGLLLASEHPGLLSRLVISGANTRPDGLRSGWHLLFKLMYALRKDTKLKLMLTEPDITADMLHRIQIPTTVLAGSKDMIKELHTKNIASQIKKSTLHILQGEDHGSYIVHSEKIGGLILDACGKRECKD